MIFYLASHDHRYTMDSFIRSWGKALEDRVGILSYNYLLQSMFGGRFFVTPGTYIFSDIERIKPKTAQILAEMWKGISNMMGDGRLLNHPVRSMKRYELLRTLWEGGTNRFNVYQLDDDVVPERFPVFVRGENDHMGNVTALISTPEDFFEAKERLGAERDGLKDKLIVEFLDTSHGGIFRKYSAFAVGNEIIPRHIFFSRNWMVKTHDMVDEGAVAEEREYVLTNPHETRLRELFRIARIDYGRIDYSLLEDEIQVWEINTNPMLASSISAVVPERKEVHEIFSERIVAALKAVDR
jgi:hypothetical protein